MKKTVLALSLLVGLRQQQVATQRFHRRCVSVQTQLTRHSLFQGCERRFRRV